MKHIQISPSVSKTQVKKLDGFNKKATDLNCYLIGQLGKNDLYKDKTEGKIILQYAISTLKSCYHAVGGRVALIECKNKKKLIDFYKDNDFSELQIDSKTQLMQMVLTLQSELLNSLSNLLQPKDLEASVDSNTHVHI